MKINYIGYLNPYKYNGGAEMSMRSLLDYGANIGHEIKITSVLPYPSFDIFKKSDLYFLTDNYNCPWHWRRFHRSLVSKIPFSSLNKYFKLLDYIVKSGKYIHFDNAYVDVCDLGYLPCNGNVIDFICDFKRNNSPCFSKKRTELYRNSKLNIFVSPLHREIIKKLIGVENIGNTCVCKPLINTNIFYNRNLKRDIENLYVGIICEAKGLDNLRIMYKNKEIFLIGKIATGSKLDFGTHIGQIDCNKVAEYMNRAKKFIYLPRWPEPQGRVVIEAALCGCNMITNKNVGAVSFGFDISNPINYAHAKDEIWEEIERLVNE